jgi:hypothetical protein
MTRTTNLEERGRGAHVLIIGEDRRVRGGQSPGQSRPIPAEAVNPLTLP